MDERDELSSLLFWGIGLGILLLLLGSSALPLPERLSVSQGMPYQSARHVFLCWTFTGWAEALALVTWTAAAVLRVAGVLAELRAADLLAAAGFAVAFALPVSRLAVSLGLWS